MRKKLTPKKKLKGFKYHKKRLILFISFALIGILSIIFLPDKQKYFPECANTYSCIEDLSGNYEEDNKGEFAGKKVTGPAIAGKPYIRRDLAINNKVLGEASGDRKRIYIDLSTQRLLAFEDNTLVYEFPVSTGKWWPTPTGDFRIWIKLRYTRMSGGNKADGTYYNLPNVPYTMYFYNDKIPKYRGYGIHGAYWHNNFGHPMSHGCINMRESDVAQLYAWANPPTAGNVTYANNDNLGTLVTIYGVTPSE